MNFGEKLKTLRIKQELSQEKLAEMLNVSRQAVTKWENHNGMPDIENLKAISKIFDVTIDSLVFEEEEIESTDDAFCWNFACTAGIVGIILGVILQDIVPNIGVMGIGLGAIGYLVAKAYLMFNSIKNNNKR